MVHKLRDMMGKNHAKTLLKGGVELDEAYITTDREESMSIGEKCKLGSGSKRKSKVAVLIESEEVTEEKKKEIDGRKS